MAKGEKTHKGKKLKIEISKKTLLIIAVIAIIVIIGLLVFYLYKSGKLISGKKLETKIKSEVEAAEKLTDVAGDIASLKEELGSLTKTIKNP